jgi:ABC-2 type transport system permease protein
MSAAEVSAPARPLPLGRGSARVFALALDSMLRTRRGVFAAALGAVPVLIASAFRWLRPESLPSAWGASELYHWMVTSYFVSNALPLVALFYAGSLVADELEGRTIVYLLTRPVSRTTILVGRFAAFLAAGLALTLPALIAVFLIVGRAEAGLSSVGTLARDLGVAGLTLLAYGALFVLAGVVFRRPLLAGLLFLYGWEWLVYAPGHVPRLTLTAYLRALTTPPPATQEGAASLLSAATLPVGESLLSLAVAVALFLTLARVLFCARELLPEG